MLGVFHKFSVLFLSVLILIIIPEGHNYEPPGTARYPLGDEALNNDILSNQYIEETTSKDFKSFKSSCTQSAKGILNNPHVSCPTDFVGPTDVLFSSNILTPSPELSCKRCDLQVKPNKEGVIVHCYECYDKLPTEQNRNKRDIIYLTYFLEISDYL